MTRAARALYALLLGLWAGAGLYHLVVIVPNALSSFSSKPDAQAFLGRTATELDHFALLAGPLILLSLYLGYRRLGPRAALIVLATIAAAVSGHWLGPKIAELERQLAAGVAVNLELNTLYMVGDGLTIATVVIAVLLLLGAPGPQESRSGSRIELGGIRS